MELGPGRDLGAACRRLVGTVLVDSLGAWVAGMEGFRVDHDRLYADFRGRADAGGGLTVSGQRRGRAGVRRRPRPASLCRCPRPGQPAVAAVSDEVLLVVAGRVLALGGGG